MRRSNKSISKITGVIINIEELTVTYYIRHWLPLFLRISRQVAELSHECQTCRRLQIQIAQLGVNLPDHPPMTRRNLEEYLDMMKCVTRHLKRSHGLIEKRYYVKRFILLGFTFGISLVLLGLILLSCGVTFLALNITLIALVPRVAFSCTVGYFLDIRAKKQGRVIS